MTTAVRQLSSLYPGVTEIPQEVTERVKGGTDLLSAYASYRAGEDARTIAALREENRRLEKSLKNTVRAPVRGVSGGGQAQGPKDEFLDAFLREFNR